MNIANEGSAQERAASNGECQSGKDLFAQNIKS